MKCQRTIIYCRRQTPFFLGINEDTPAFKPSCVYGTFFQIWK